jgi:Transcriptional regulator SbtR-like, C-terminal domain
MGEALRSAAGSGSPLFADTKARILAALRLLLDAGAASGTLRTDVDPADVMRVMHGIWYLPDGPEWRADVGRMLDLIIDGLRYGAPEPATGTGATVGEMARLPQRETRTSTPTRP